MKTNFLRIFALIFPDFFFLFLEYDQPHESQTNKDILETINRKGLGGPDSPEAEDVYIGDDASPRLVILTGVIHKRELRG